MTDTAPAAATGLPSATATAFDRRSFLATLAAAGVLTTGVEQPVTAAPPAHPDAELLGLAALLKGAMDRANDADEVVGNLRAAHVKPPLPEACYWVKRDFLHWTGFSFEADHRVDRTRRAYVGSTMDRFRTMVDDWKFSQNSTCPNDESRARAREIFEAHDAWEREVKASEDAAGITAARDTVHCENELADTLACRIPTIAARTPEGVAAKAFAMRTWWGRDRDGFARVLRHRLDDPESDPWEAIAISMAIDAERVCAGASSAPVAA